jgi:hypothetical protein
MILHPMAVEKDFKAARALNSDHFYERSQITAFLVQINATQVQSHRKTMVHTFTFSQDKDTVWQYFANPSPIQVPSRAKKEKF